jgi:F-type H+-transporting ATPase subunit delta
MITLGGSSRQSLASLRAALDERVKSSRDCSAMSLDLFAALSVLDGSPALRRALTDPTRDATSKAHLVGELFGKSQGGLGTDATALISLAVGLRWSAPSDLADSIEQLAVEAEASAANISGELERVSNELFTFSRLLVENPDLRQALNTPTETHERKRELVKAIFAKKCAISTEKLLEHVVSGIRGRNIERTLDAYTHAISARRERVNALVRSAIALTDSQRTFLAETLGKKIGQPVHLNVEIDPTVIGGVSIRFADEIIDGTISNRLAEASRALVAK